VRLAAKQKPHRPGIAPALGLRADSVIRDSFFSFDENES
jgi:hypothetical protein